jgi:nucleoside-diphosphate-sugar epimerase/aryl carrier-like protein
MLTHATVRNYAHTNDNNSVVCKIIKESYESIASVTNIVFDIFVTESILPLLNGLTVYFADDDEVFSQQKLSDLIQSNRIDVMQTTPTKMKGYMLDKDNLSYLSKLKTIILGGEALTSDLYLELKMHTNAEIHNIYGPAETTVWSTNAQITSTDITIGKPIANTQIYILDRNRKPMPIGVAGELCISGDGVGKGYLNRPELTAEKFIPNPFIEGKTMYCTGDLARWRTDGELEYLGRIDTQVKIRGLRIELGEIESVMSGFDGIGLTAVADKRDDDNRQYLVGYYTSSKDVDEKALRQHLSAKLPKYMVPNYFVRLEQMPMTASGKIDRKNLPVPDFTENRNEYVAPETETEIKLCKLLEKLFGLEKVGVTDDFFELGGDSLKAIEYTAKAHNAGIEIALQQVFDYPTVRELCRLLENGAKRKILYTKADFEKYNELLNRNVPDDNFVPIKKSLGNVLLTGATGFLGAHILDNLMKNEIGKIYCLVRNHLIDERYGKLFETVQYYFGDKYDNDFGKRIILIVGDIENENLSDNIPVDVQTVIHTAATVKHYGSYQYFHTVNVQGTLNVINYAKKVSAKLIHISTLSVSGNGFADDFSISFSNEEKHFDECCLFVEQELENVYVRSKFEAEKAVLDAVLDGLDAKIIRVGNLTNRASDFKFQPNYRQNAFLTRVKAGLEFGKLPEYIVPLYAEFSPIDETADGVIRIAQ